MDSVLILGAGLTGLSAGRYLKNKSDFSFFDSRDRENLPENFIIRNTGSAALDLAYLSSGRFDGCLHKNVNLWDIAAGTVLIKEAGGIVDNFEKKKI